MLECSYFFALNVNPSVQLTDSYVINIIITGSGRVFSGFGIWPKYGTGIGKMINILTGSGIWMFPGKQDLPRIGHGIRDLCLRVCRECWKPSRPTGSTLWSAWLIGLKPGSHMPPTYLGQRCSTCEYSSPTHNQALTGLPAKLSWIQLRRQASDCPQWK